MTIDTNCQDAQLNETLTTLENDPFMKENRFIL